MIDSRVRAGRLCMIVHGPYPVGEPRVAREVHVALDEGYEVDVVAMRRPRESPLETVDGACVMRLPIVHQRGAGPLTIVREYVGFTVLAAMRVARLCRRRRYTVVHVHNPPDFLMLAAIFPRLLGARTILDIHDLSPEMFATRLGERRGAAAAFALLRWIERWAARFADAVITVHEPYRRELVGRGVPPEKLTVVMNSVDERLLPPPAASGDADAFRVVYHGTVTPLYGVQLLVEAAAQLAREVPGLRLEIYGEGDAVPTVRRLAEHRGVEERLHLSEGYLPQREVLRRVQGASVGVIPNLPSEMNRFALSSKLFEYVALGIPVVCADLPTLREHFADGEIRFFRAGDAEALADALRDIASNPTAAAERTRAAERRYEEYRWHVSAKRYAAILNREAEA